MGIMAERIVLYVRSVPRRGSIKVKGNGLTGFWATKREKANKKLKEANILCTEKKELGLLVKKWHEGFQEVMKILWRESGG